CAQNTWRLRRRKLFVPGSTLRYLVIFGMSIARVDQKAIFARNKVTTVVSFVPAQFQMFNPFAFAVSSSTKYIQIDMAMIAGAATSANFSTALIPYAVFAICATANNTYQS